MSRMGGAREGPKVPFACICVHLRSIIGLKTAIWTANGRKWGLGATKNGDFQQENRKVSTKTGWEGVGNYEIREKRENWA